MSKAVEAKDLLPSGVIVVRGSKWKAKWLAEWDDPAEWKLPVTSRSPSMQLLREKFGGKEIYAATAPEATTTTSGRGVMKTPAALATPPPPILQLAALVTAAVAGTPTQAVARVGFAIPSPLQPAALVVLAMVRAPAQAAVAGIPVPALVAAADIPPQRLILVWEEPQPPSSSPFW